MNSRALVVEDEPDLRLALRINLEAEGYDVETAADGDAALVAVREGRFDVVLLDLRLPKRDGTEVLREMRAAGDRTPVICLTARAEERDRVLGLDLGADDYVTKPFSVAELLARVRAVLRRGRGESAAELDLGAVQVLIDDRAVVRGAAREGLTSTEASILAYLGARLGHVVARERLLQDLWGVDRGATTRTLDNHVARIRKKLEIDVAEPRHLLTVHGAGYRLVADGVR